MFLKVSALGVGSVQNSNFTIGDVISVFMFENGINDFAALSSLSAVPAHNQLVAEKSIFLF